MSRQSRNAAIVTVLSVAGQLVGLVTQVVIAGIFGARADMDAFLAASTLPQYVVAVLLGALSAVFVPVFLDSHAAGKPADAWRLASSVVTLAGVALAALAAVGVVSAGFLLRLTTPGLSAESLDVAVRVARVTWPTIAASGIIGLVTGICHATGRFTWPAIIPVLGAVLNLVLVLVLAPRWGVFGVAVAATVSLFVQTAFFLRDVVGHDRLTLSFDWRHPGIARVATLLWPLVLSALLIRYTPIVDRYLASGMPEGAIAHLGYAFKLVTFLVVFIPSGIAAVVFPRMALDMSLRDLDGVRRTISLAMRVMWLGVAPLIAIGAVLAYPFITVLLERNAFVAADTAQVAVLWQIYLLSLIGACLGSVTGRAFYAMKATRTIAVMGVIEAAGYAAYTSYLAWRFGVVGVAIGYVLYYSLSIAWQVPVLMWRLGRKGGPELLSSFGRTLAAAAVAGAGAYAVASFWGAPWPQLIGGGMIASALYVLCLRLWGGPEVQWTTQALKGMAASRHS